MGGASAPSLDQSQMAGRDERGSPGALCPPSPTSVCGLACPSVWLGFQAFLSSTRSLKEPGPVPLPAPSALWPLNPEEAAWQLD